MTDDSVYSIRQAEALPLEERYYVQTERVRHEPTIYYVQEKITGRMVTEPTKNKRTAVRQLERIKRKERANGRG